jgi:hypothetical protein
MNTLALVPTSRKLLLARIPSCGPEDFHITLGRAAVRFRLCVGNYLSDSTSASLPPLARLMYDELEIESGPDRWSPLTDPPMAAFTESTEVAGPGLGGKMERG